METYIATCKQPASGRRLHDRELKPGLCNNPEGWEWAGGGRELQEEGTHAHLRLMHVDV